MDNCSTAVFANATADTCPLVLDPLPDMEPFTAEQLQSGAVVIHVFILLYMFLALAIVCDEYFVPALEVLVEVLNISPDVAGATFMAAGGSMPELFTSTIGTFQESSVGFGTIVGSAVFNVLFVIGCCALASKETLQLTWWPLFRDCTYYIASLIVVALFFGILSCREITFVEALILLLMYAGYCTVMKFNEQLRRAIVYCLPCGGCCSSPASESAKVAPGGEDGKDGKDGDSSAKDGKDGDSFSNRVSTDGARRASRDKRGSNRHHATLTRGYTGQLDLDKVGDFHQRRPRVQLNMLNTFLDESPLMSGAALLTMRQAKANLRTIFDTIDTDRSGQIDRGEVQQLLAKLWGREVGEGEAEEALKEIDTDDDQCVSYREFTVWYLESDKRMEAELSAKFDALDLDGSGLLSVDELRPLLDGGSSGTDGPDDEAIAAAINEINQLTKDDATSGKVNKTEFSAWYKASMFWAKEQHSAQKAAAMERSTTLWRLPAGGCGVKLRYCVVLPLLVLLAYTIPDVRKPRHRKLFPLSFGLAIAWIGAFSYVMVWMATCIGVAAGIPSVVMGLTLLAAGTSIPDLLTSVLVARAGEGDMAVSSSIGSNIFDVLVGLPLPWLLYSLVHWPRPVSVVADSLFTSIIVLFIMLGAVITTVAAAGWRMTRSLGAVMFALYAVFVLQDLMVQFCVVRIPEALKPCSGCP